MWIRDPKTKEKSVTVTLLVATWIVGAFKVLFSGMTILGMTFGQFSGVDFGALLTSVAGIYGWRKHQSNPSKSIEKPDK